MKFMFCLSDKKKILQKCESCQHVQKSVSGTEKTSLQKEKTSLSFPKITEKMGGVSYGLVLTADGRCEAELSECWNRARSQECRERAGPRWSTATLRFTNTSEEDTYFYCSFAVGYQETENIVHAGKLVKKRETVQHRNCKKKHEKFL